ncbi:unnamed protein product, partial [Rotaria sordida]
MWMYWCDMCGGGGWIE